ncbi:MAG: GNAT family N-acetyltransferase [Candidatus Heimdallarchaeota archaeon]|nr:GNAT family N-acetyltransferase [Candidatus Heimdallarchaeota archaeon]
MHDIQLIRFYQELSTNAWPAKYYYLLNGWIVRISEGVTKRANSVIPLTYYGDKLLEDIQVIEAIYTKNKLPVIFQLPDYYEPKNLLKTLVESNYRIIDETRVMVAKFEDMSDIPVNQDYSYQKTTETKNDWFNTLSVSERGTQERIKGQKAIIRRILQPKCFFSAKHEEKIIGVGMGVLEQGNLGIYDMIVNPDYRRQGIAASIIAQMVEWGKANSCHSVYLCVQGDNQAAIALYEKVGLKESFGYRYLIKK